MAVSTVRRKRAIAVIFAVCLVTAVFLYKKGVREHWNDTEHRGTRETDNSRLDLSNRVGVETNTAPLPTKMYDVVELEEEESVEPVTNDDEDEEKETERDEMEENKNDKIDEKVSTDETRKRNEIRQGDEADLAKGIINLKEEEKIASSERGVVSVEKNDKTVVARGRKLVKKQTGGDKLKQIIQDENLEFKIGKKIMKENEEIGKHKNHIKENVEEGKDQMKSISSENLNPTEKIKNQTRIREESSRLNKAHEREESRKQSNKSPFLVDHVRSTGKPTETSRITRFIKRALVLKHSTAKPYPTIASTKDISKVTTVPSSPKAKSIQATRNQAGSTGTLPRTETTKTTWVDKTTKLNNPRLNKMKQPTTKAETNPFIAGQSTKAKVQIVASKEEPLTCKIPTFDPFHPHVSRLQVNVGTNLRKICRSMYPYTPVFNVINNKLTLKDDVKQDSISMDSIQLQEIIREDDENFMYHKTRNPFNGLSNIYESNDIGKSDFFRVKYKIKGREASDLYARVSPRLDVLESQTKLARDFKGKGLPLNVLMIGFDSTSRANFVRKLPRVKAYLETKLTTFIMEGMSIVGDATTPILAAMLTGKDETVLPEGRTSYGGRPIDNWPWIMKDYEQQGYVTLYAEDDPSVSAFNLRLQGFTDSPTHHYMRPFWLSLESEHERDEPGRCSKSESMVNHTLKYVESFFDAYPTLRKFAFTFHSYISHAHPNHLSYAEEDLLWFLRTFMDKGYLKDTMLVIMGDHGSRNSEYRGTMQGKLEERLPWFSISLPSDFQRRFSPDLVANLRGNQPVITSSFDVHATLRHILTYPNLPSGEHTKSLFERLPRNRTCKDAGIAEHWCPCLDWSPTGVNSKHVQSVARSAVEIINEKLSTVPLLDRSCHKLSLGKVLDAVKLRANKKVEEFHDTDQDGDRRVNYGWKTPDLLRYQIIFTTEPNEGEYEVTAHVSARNRVTVNPEISRLNRYNNQPACIAKKYPYARKFCYCRTSG